MTIETTIEKKEPEIIYDAIPWNADKMEVEPNLTTVSSYPTGNDNVDAVRPANTGPPIPEGHERFYCSQCNTHYDLPNRATSWRCQNCHHFNSTAPGECEWCTIS